VIRITPGFAAHVGTAPPFLTVVSFLVLASRIQKLDRITWQDDVAIESVRLG
jgi:hypothetical protein